MGLQTFEVNQWLIKGNMDGCIVNLTNEWMNGTPIKVINPCDDFLKFSLVHF
jgi:hypothetical protein